MKSIPLSTGVFAAILGLSIPAHAETTPSSDPLLDLASCDECHLSPTGLNTVDLSFSQRPAVQLKQTHTLFDSSSSVKPNQRVSFQSIKLKQANLAPAGATDTKTNLAISSDTTPQFPLPETTHSPRSRPTPFSPQQALISQETAQQQDVPLPISTSAADLAQADAVPSFKTDAKTDKDPNEDNGETSFPLVSPLANQQFQQPTAIHLPQGAVALSLYNRLFFVSEQEGTAAYPNIGVTWGITDSTELDLTLQVVDTGSPDRLGGFTVRRVSNRDLTLSVKQKLWTHPSDNLALSGSFSLAFPLTKRTFEFNPGNSEDSSLIPAIQLPLTASVGNRWQFTLSPTIAFFPSSNAVFIPRAPITNPGSFGTTLGLSGAISYQVHPRVTLWGDAFVPFTGNNSFNRDTGLPAKSIAYNAGLRYFINPSLGIDVFASNTFGSKGPLALTADRDMTALGVRVIALPSIFSANRAFADSFNRDQDGQDSPITTDGLGFFDGGTVPNQRFLWHLQGGGQGIMTALRYGITKDFELSAYLDYIFGDVDESEQGFGVKLRLLNQDEGAPFTGSAAVTVGLTNNLFDNFDNNNRNGLFRQGAPKDFPLIFLTDSPEGRRFVVSLSLPLHYKVNDQLAFWFTPSASFVQRNDLEIGGFNVGGSIEVIQDLSLVGELGANLFGEGNTFIGNTLADRIPWSVAVRWNPRSIIGGDGSNPNQPNVEFFVTNRVGSSTWHQLRVRDQNEITVGAGISIPF